MNQLPYEIIDPSRFIHAIDGKEISLITLSNASNVCVQISNFGARIVAIWTADKAGQFDDVVLGFDSVQPYLHANAVDLGATIGQFANRIAHAQYQLKDEVIQLEANEGIHHLHGGSSGFQQSVWAIESMDKNTVVMSYLSPDGESGFPGNVLVRLTYKLTEQNELSISYQASTDAATPISLTNHSYFNLSGAGNGTIDQHRLTIHADQFLPVDSDLIPTGEYANVNGTVMDFTKPKAIASQIEASNELKQLGGYDHCYVLPNKGNKIKHVAHLFEPQSGRTMDVKTNAPGMQFYTSNHFDGSLIGKRNKPYHHRGAFCLECQSLPNSPNQANFPNSILEIGNQYEATCIYRFGVID